MSGESLTLYAFAMFTRVQRGAKVLGFVRKRDDGRWVYGPEEPDGIHWFGHESRGDAEDEVRAVLNPDQK